MDMDQVDIRKRMTKMCLDTTDLINISILLKIKILIINFENLTPGSAHTVLAPYWTNIIKKQRLIARQCSLRGGDLYLKISEDNRRLDVAGESVIVIEGTIDIS